MTEIVPYQNAKDVRAWIELMAPAAELAKAVANTGFVPGHLRNNPAGIVAVILYGDELGIGPMQSIAAIKMIDGTPTLLAKTQRALVLAAGHEMWPEEQTATKYTWAGRRRGSDQIVKSTWTLDDARRANLAGRGPWKLYPRQMLSARASSELVALHFSDVVAGILAAEEVDGTDDTATGLSRPVGEVGADTGQEPEPTRKRRRTKTTSAVAVPPAPPTLTVVETPPLPPLPGEDDADKASTLTRDDAPEKASKAQLTKMHVLFNERGVINRDRRLEYTRQVIDRPDLESSKDLTPGEAARLIDDLESWDAEQGAAPPPEEPPEP